MENITAKDALDKFIELALKQGKKNILDIGCGITMPHSNIMRKAGLTVKTCDFFPENDYRGIFTEIDFPEKFDGIWASHVLEHQKSVGIFLDKINEITTPDALISITVPPQKPHRLTSGHLTVFNLGLLYYNLVLAKFDCSNAIHKKYGYNISAIMNKKSIINMPELAYDFGDLEKLSHLFPAIMNVKQYSESENIPNTF